MCGISGIVSSVESRNQLETEVRMLVGGMKHRGPDANGIHSFPNGVFGHNRLAIIDLDSRANQPMKCEKSGNIIVFNGEIYNFRELKAQIEKHGLTFRTNSDTEVILNGYLLWEDELWTKLDGFFSIAVWDQNKNKLVLARDPFGVKPLYFGFKGNKFFFSSEMKPLIKARIAASNLDFQAISDYFTYSYVCAPRTPFEEIRQVEPGTSVSLINFNKILIHKYWKIDQDKSIYDDEEIVGILRNTLLTSIEASLVSDVPIGLLLSGGIDSNIIYNLLNKNEREKIICLTATFFEQGFDEGKIIKQTYGDNRNMKFIDCGTNNILQTYQEMIKNLDTLNANTASVPEMKLFSGTTENDLKVMLTGSGLDELFGGYITYRADKINKYYSQIPINLRKTVEYPLRFVKNSDSKYPLKFMIERFTSGVGADPLRSHVWWRSVFTPEDKVRLFDLEFIESNSGLDLNSLDPYRKIFDSHTDFDDLNKLMICDLYRFLGDNANILMDNFSMMHSIEARPPFLNKELVKIAMNINSNRKIGLLKGKKILRESVQSDLPKNIKRQKKAGLVAPQSKWLRNELKPLLEETRSELKDSLPFMNSKYVDEIFDDHLTGKSNNSLQVNAVITLNYWLKEF